MLLLVPADPLRPTRPDEHFAAEARAARDAGVTVAVVDHDALARGGAVDRAVGRVPEDDDAVYRGWMLRAEHYAGFASALARRGVGLRTGAEQYRRAHELPGWWADLAAVTPESVWTEGPGRAGFDEARRELGAGAAVLRDYTKSVKHHWHEAAYIPDLADAEAAWAVAARFLELRDDEFTGGFVLRRFEEFTGSEVRTWWVGGECVLTGPHPDSPHDVVGSPSLEVVAPVVGKAGLPFVTVDFALRADGAWRVVELGDGQVSDRPVTMVPEALVAALFAV
ncbi:ATP-grasp domain-containing protein [Umezawaea sp.]|uniref:ATP-grasp domain-containing protein n=1 Tax=Umezawaea sp. TaxID=1955258 RepID=UPI002ED6415F